jgi:hypothetical protein
MRARSLSDTNNTREPLFLKGVHSENSKESVTDQIRQNIATNIPSPTKVQQKSNKSPTKVQQKSNKSPTKVQQTSGTSETSIFVQINSNEGAQNDTSATTGELFQATFLPSPTKGSASTLSSERTATMPPLPGQMSSSSGSIPKGTMPSILGQVPSSSGSTPKGTMPPIPGQESSSSESNPTRTMSQTAGVVSALKGLVSNPDLQNSGLSDTTNSVGSLASMDSTTSTHKLRVFTDPESTGGVNPLALVSRTTANRILLPPAASVSQPKSSASPTKSSESSPTRTMSQTPGVVSTLKGLVSNPDLQNSSLSGTTTSVGSLASMDSTTSVSQPKSSASPRKNKLSTKPPKQKLSRFRRFFNWLNPRRFFNWLRK